MGFMPIVGAAMMAVGGGLAAYSTWQSGNAAYEAGEANQAVQHAAAEQTESTIAADVYRQRGQFRKFMGGLRADIAAYGGLTSEGTGLKMAQEAAVASKLDELNIVTDAINRAKTQRISGDFDLAEGAAIRAQRRTGALGQAISSFGQAGMALHDSIPKGA